MAIRFRSIATTLVPAVAVAVSGCVGLPSLPSPLGQDESSTGGEPSTTTTTGLGSASDRSESGELDGSSSQKPESQCGDGVVEGDEACDLGPANGTGDSCRDDCQLNECGDGYVAETELCDDGNDSNFDDCTNSCRPPSCGDGLIQPPEQCDDGEARNDDKGACLPSCLLASCGDGLVHDGVEACDGEVIESSCERQGFDGGTIACAKDCLTLDVSECFACGDGIAEDEEECDGDDFQGLTCDTFAPPGTTAGGSLLCTASCQIDASACTFCGNGIREGTEQCDELDFGGQGCVDLPGFGGGNLNCTDDCAFETSNCCIAAGQPCTASAACCSSICIGNGGGLTCASP
ncbi:MAG: DUF4215 domain-containing protein [Myxococcota bacterium]